MSHAGSGLPEESSPVVKTTQGTDVSRIEQCVKVRATVAAIQAAIEVIHQPNGKVFEIRAFHSMGKIVAAGYFDDTDEAARAAFLLDEEGFNVFSTLNPVRRDIMPSLNHIARGPQRLTSSADIAARDWLLV